MNILKIVALSALFFASSSLFEMGFAKYLFNPLYYSEIFRDYISDIYIILNQVGILFISLFALKLFKLKVKITSEKILSKHFINFSILYLIFSIISSQISTQLYILFIDNYQYKILANSKPIFNTTEFGIDYNSVLKSLLIQCFLVPIVQELFFRNVIYQYLRIKSGYFLSAAISSLIFSVIHQEIISTFILSMFICYAYDRFGYYGAMIIHMAHNIFILSIYVIYFSIYDMHLIIALNNANTVSFIFVVLFILSVLLIILRSKIKVINTIKQ